MPLPLPPKDEQEAISGLFNATEERVQVERTTLAALMSAKTSLMSVLLTGEVRVKPEEAA